MLTIATTPGVYSALKSKHVFFLRKGVLSHTYTYRVLSALRIRVTWGAETMLTCGPTAGALFCRSEVLFPVGLEGRGQLRVKLVGQRRPIELAAVMEMFIECPMYKTRVPMDHLRCD